jgi:predicted RNase H-like HicB family nuclease
MQRFYTAIIEKASKGYGVFFPDLPGCTSFGETVEKAAANAFVAAQAHAALAGEYGEKLPAPRAPDQIPADPGVKEKARLLIPVESGDEPVRVNISLPSAALEALDRTAKELSLTRSGAIAHLAMSREATTGRYSGRVRPATLKRKIAKRK